jgi:lysine/ornithine N-monooxygenase
VYYFFLRFVVVQGVLSDLYAMAKLHIIKYGHYRDYCTWLATYFFVCFNRSKHVTIFFLKKKVAGALLFIKRKERYYNLGLQIN